MKYGTGIVQFQVCRKNYLTTALARIFLSTEKLFRIHKTKSSFLWVTSLLIFAITATNQSEARHFIARYSVGQVPQNVLVCSVLHYVIETINKQKSNQQHHSTHLLCLAKHHCLAPSYFGNSLILTPSHLKKQYKVGEWLQYSCKPGFCVVGENKLRCSINGWNKPPICRCKLF